MSDDLMLCSKCNGEGHIKQEDFDPLLDDKGIICPKCHGHKKVDWVENIVGKEIPEIDNIAEFFKTTQTMMKSMGIPESYLKCDGNISLEDLFKKEK